MKTIAIYPGSFNPFTIGHQNILEKAERIFGKDNVIVAIGVNPDKLSFKNYKEYITSALEEELYGKVNVLKHQLPSKKIEGYIGFLTEYIREKEAEGYNVVVIRGLRNGYDFDYEYNSCRFCWDQFPEINIIMIPSDPIYTHISSSAYRALESVKPGAGHYLLASG